MANLETKCLYCFTYHSFGSDHKRRWFNFFKKNLGDWSGV